MLRIGPRDRPEHVYSKSFDGRAGRTECAMQQRKTNSRGIDQNSGWACQFEAQGCTGTVVGYKVDRTGTKLPTH